MCVCVCVDGHAYLNNPAAILPFSVDCCLLLIRVMEGLKAIGRKDPDRLPVHYTIHSPTHT